MKTYVLDVVCQTTYCCEVEASDAKEAEKKARVAWQLDQLNKIDEGIVEIDVVEEF